MTSTRSSTAGRWATSRRSVPRSTMPSAGPVTPGRSSAGAMVADRPLVGVVGGSRSDFPILEGAVGALERFGVPSELRVVSAHRTPDHLFRYAEGAAGRGIRVIIAGAG